MKIPNLFEEKYLTRSEARTKKCVVDICKKKTRFSSQKVRKRQFCFFYFDKKQVKLKLFCILYNINYIIYRGFICQGIQTKCKIVLDEKTYILNIEKI